MIYEDHIKTKLVNIKLEEKYLEDLLKTVKDLRKKLEVEEKNYLLSIAEPFFVTTKDGVVSGFKCVDNKFYKSIHIGQSEICYPASSLFSSIF